MNTLNKKALIYCRVSSKKQELEGSGLSSQEKRCREYASVQGYEVEAVFHDSFSGAGDFMKRPAMNRLLCYVDEHPQNNYVVIFDDLKRFARDLKFHWELRAEFQSRNLIPHCLNFTFEETPEGAFIETIIAAQGELERQQIKRQTLQKMKARLQRGIYCIPKPPYGYKYEKSKLYGGKILIKNKKEADIISQAFTNFVIGKLYYIKDVMDFINKHPLNNKRKLNIDTIKRMLTNIVYTGYIEYVKWNIPLTKGIHEPIISLKLFEEIKQKLSGKIPQRTRKDMRSDFPLRGYVNCIYCHHPLTASWSTSSTKNKHPYYRCNDKFCIIKGKSIPQTELHKYYKAYIEKLTPKDDIILKAKSEILLEAIYREKNKMIIVENQKKEIAAIDLQITSLVEHIITDPKNALIKVYENEIKKLENKKLILEESINKNADTKVKLLELMMEKGFKTFANPYSTWVNGNYKKQKIVQTMLFNTNLEYGRKEYFGTNNKSYILRLFDEIKHDSEKKSGYVPSSSFSWNENAKSSLLKTHWDEIIKEIKRNYSFVEELNNSD